MDYDLEQGLAVLERTPAALRALLLGLPDAWLMSNEGGDSWSPYDVIGHLVHLEKTDWIGRTRIIMEHGAARPFDPVDRFAMLRSAPEIPLVHLLDEFAALRQKNIAALRGMHLSAADLEREGRHPALGGVTLKQLLAAWVVHDLNHLHQIAKTMAKQYREAVGPWREYLLVVDA